VILWYLAITLLGWAVYPALRLALPGLSDHGYPLARTAGMLALSYFAWLAFFPHPHRNSPSASMRGNALFGLWLAYRQRHEIGKADSG
jgi:hypothetical protein